jgi:hypothetical protein
MQIIKICAEKISSAVISLLPIKTQKAIVFTLYIARDLHKENLLLSIIVNFPLHHCEEYAFFVIANEVKQSSFANVSGLFRSSRSSQ